MLSSSCSARRLDQAMLEQGLVPSREQAKRAILAGQVRVNGQRARKPSDEVRPGDELGLDAPAKYVSRGGHKLEHAFQYFGAPTPGFRAIDAGASTGGFTDCMLQHGASLVYAIDVGHGQLAWKLRRDPRVVVMERTNVRHLTAAAFPRPFEPVDFAAIDCSFISLRRVLQPVVALARPGARLMALIKPQFEAGKAEADRGAGVIRDPVIHQRVVAEVEAWVRSTPGLNWMGVVQSPLEGPAGNIEFLAGIEKTN